MIELHDALELLRGVIAPRRANLNGRVGLAVAARGRWLIDGDADDVITAGWDDAVATAVLMNEATFVDFVLGRFSPATAGPEHLFVWTGEEAPLLALAAALQERADKPWHTRLQR